MKPRIRGFTIVELLIVIVVIAILAAITIVSYNGIQARALDARRASDMNTIKKKLEIFYADKGYYPSSNDFLENAAFRKEAIEIPDALITSPQQGPMQYCWAKTAHDSGNKDPYCYVGYLRGGWDLNQSDCTAPGARCVGFTLSYWSTTKGAEVRIEGGDKD